MSTTNLPKLYLTDLEQALADDQEGVYQRQVCQELEEQAAAVRQSIDAGLAPEEFPVARGLEVGLKAALAVVRQTWKEENEQSDAPVFRV